MFIGIDDHDGTVYESMGSSPDRPVIPLPMVSRAKIIEAAADWKSLGVGPRLGGQTWIFREDSFDAVTRTRRGRLYQAMEGAAYPNHQSRVMPLPFEQMAHRSSIGPDGRFPRPLHVYAAATSLFERPSRSLGSTLALGTSLAASSWRVVDVEMTASGDVMLTLKAQSAYGLVPTLEAAKVDERFRDEIASALRKVVDSAFKESATAVVDQCRDATTLIASRWIAQQSGEDNVLGKDLAKVAEALAQEPWRKFAASNIAKTIAILHSRGKSNEQHAKGVKPPGDDDAEFALHAVGLLLRELGWAQPRF